jgi:hypothetical protein
VADLLKWGGDALLLLFDDADHSAAQPGQRCACTELLRRSDAPRLYRPSQAAASAGIDSGPVPPDTRGKSGPAPGVGSAGPTATAVTMLEHAAGIGEVLVGDATAATLGPEAGTPARRLGSSPWGRTDARQPSIASGTGADGGNGSAAAAAATVDLPLPAVSRNRSTGPWPWPSFASTVRTPS